MPRRPPASVLRTLCAAAAWWLLGAFGPVQALPHAGFTLQLDGVPDEWRAPAFERRWQETQAPLALRNRVRARMAWTLDELLIAAEVQDADRVDAPAAIEVEQFHQYDSIQVYLDPLADSTQRMNADDLDLLLLPDGRSGVLRGDELIAELADVRVPQRQAAPLSHRYAARRTAQGWSFELAIPWSGLGVRSPPSGAIRVDLAMNDWVRDHAPGASSAITLQTLRQGGTVSDAAVASEVGTQLWPLGWSGQRDFGFPQRWLSLRLVGGPTWVERALRALGPSRGAVLVLILLAAVAGIGHWLGERRATQHLRRLLMQWPSSPPRPHAEAALATVAAETPADAGFDSRDRAFAERAVAHVRAHLDADLSPSALASALHVSLRSLQRHLREGLDTTPQELVLAARLAAAHELLAAGGLRVSEVAFRVGFSDLSHFSRRFRAAYGVAPSRVGPALAESG